jgi:hypothetical protein
MHAAAGRADNRVPEKRAIVPRLISVAGGEAVGMVGTHPPLQKSLANAGAKVVDLPSEPVDDLALTAPLAHLVVPVAAADDPWLAPGAAAATVRPGGAVLVGVRHRWTVGRRGGLSARNWSGDWSEPASWAARCSV